MSFSRKSLGYVVFLQMALTFAGSALLQAKPGFPVFGYLPMYDSTGPYGDPINLNDNAKFPWDRMTHVMEAFAQANANGTISFPIPQRANLVLKAHQNNTRCILSIGGAGSNNANWSSAVSATYRAAFVTNLVNTTNTFNYDGIDIDWEFPQPSDKANFSAFMIALGTALHGTSISCGGCQFDGPTNKKQLTFFGSPGADICGVDWDDTTLQANVDYCIYGGYDFNAPPGYNSPLVSTWMQTGCTGIPLNYCIVNSVYQLTGTAGTNFSWPKAKLVLALPLYDKQNYSTFTSGTPLLVARRQGTFQGYDATQAESRYTVGGTTHYVNDAQAFCAKMNWALSNGLGGIGLWEITHAYPANATEVTGVWDTIGGIAACLPVTTPTPGPTPNAIPGSLIDIGNSGTLNNLWGGQWAKAAQCTTCSALVMNYLAPGYVSSLYNTPGPYAIRVSGTRSGWITISTALQPLSAAYNMDSNGYTRIDFWLKATPGNYRIAFQRTATSGDSDHYGIDFSVPDLNWNFYSFYLADSSQQGWGVAKPKNFTDVVAIVFAPVGGSGAFQMDFDDLEAVKQVVTPTPVPPSSLLDNVEDGNTTDNWGGAWTTYAPAGSSFGAVDAHAAPFPFSTFGTRYSIAASGNNSVANATASNFGTMSAALNATGSAVSLSSYNYLSFYIKASSTAGTYGVQFTNGSSFWITVNFAAPSDGNWTYVEVPLSALLPANINLVKSVSWLYAGAGTYSINLDDIQFKYIPPTPTPTFTMTRTLSPSPTVTMTPSFSSTQTMTPSNTPVPSSTFTATTSATFSSTATPANSFTGTHTPLPGSTFTNTSTISPTRTGTPSVSPSSTPSSSASPSASATPSAILPTATTTNTPLPGSTFTHTSTISVTYSQTSTSIPSHTASPTQTSTNTVVVASSTATSTETPSVTQTSTLVPTAMINDLAFTWSPNQLTVTAGTNVTWAWVGTHEVTSDTGLFTSGAATTGGSFNFTFSTAGTYRYYCALHGGVGGAGMSGIIYVTGALPPVATDTPGPSGNGALEIVAGAAVPNPSPSSMQLKLSGPADKLDIKLYTVGMNAVLAYSLPISSNGGWVTAPLPVGYAAGLGQGTYYCQVTARRGNAKGMKPWLMKFVLLK